MITETAPGSGSRCREHIGRFGSACAEVPTVGTGRWSKGLPERPLRVDGGTAEFGVPSVAALEETVDAQMSDVETWRWYVFDPNLLPGLGDDIFILGWLGTNFLLSYLGGECPWAAGPCPEGDGKLGGRGAFGAAQSCWCKSGWALRDV